MTETEFRVLHSEIIEYYQLIEMRLKGICAAILADADKSWFDRLADYDSDPFGKLIKQIKTLQSQKNIFLFSQADFEALADLRETRNYWVHQCFTSFHPVTFRKGLVRWPEFAVRIKSDFQNAVDWDEKLTEIERPLIKPPSLI